jgi:hypothetical protein
MYQYTPQYEAILPQTSCSKWSDSPRFPEERVSISPSPIKLKGDFDREFKPVRGFGSAPRKLKFPTPTSAETGVTQQDRNSPIQEERSFVSQSSLYNMDGEGSWLSVESADRSYAATSERSCSFKIGGITLSISLPFSQFYFQRDSITLFHFLPDLVCFDVHFSSH